MEMPSRQWSPIIFKVALWLILLMTAAAVAYFGFVQPKKPSGVVTVIIKPGLNTTQIADMLASKGVIPNTYTFRAYTAFTQTEDKLQPGKYKLKAGEKYYLIVKKLIKVKKKHYIKVIIPEGFTAEQIAGRLAAETGRPIADFNEYIQGSGLSVVRPDELPPELDTVEGYLFPKTYTFEKKESPRKIISKLISQFKLESRLIDWSFAKQKGLSNHQILTIASLIEKEARVPEERTLMSAVIYNRLSKGMPLQIDATVQYALPERKEVLSEEDLKIDSPYNTYKQTGLPLGPIANPGVDSIKAALAPAQVDFLYYVLTSADGHHTFTNNYNDFLKAKQQMR